MNKSLRKKLSKRLELQRKRGEYRDEYDIDNSDGMVQLKFPSRLVRDIQRRFHKARVSLGMGIHTTLEEELKSPYFNESGAKMPGLHAFSISRIRGYGSANISDPITNLMSDMIGAAPEELRNKRTGNQNWVATLPWTLLEISYTGDEKQRELAIKSIDYLQQYDTLLREAASA